MAIMKKYEVRNKVLFPILFLICFQVEAQCEKIKKVEKDVSVLYFTSFTRKLQIIKQIVKKDTIFYLNVKVTDDYLSNNVKGGKVILEGNNVINFPKAEINVEKNDTFKNGKYLYSSLVKIKKLDVVYIMAFKILGFELYMFKDDIEDNEQFSKEIQCLLQL
jgi:hypothetical protein